MSPNDTRWEDAIPGSGNVQCEMTPSDYRLLVAAMCPNIASFLTDPRTDSPADHADHTYRRSFGE